MLNKKSIYFRFMTNIFIANLDFDITSDDLRATFAQFGEVSYAHVVYDNKTKRSKGYGYVEMEDADQAIAAIQALNGMDVNGRKLDVKVASPKGSRPKKQEQPEKKEDSRSDRTPHKRPERPVNRVKDVPSDDKPRRVLRPRRKRKQD